MTPMVVPPMMATSAQLVQEQVAMAVLAERTTFHYLMMLAMSGPPSCWGRLAVSPAADKCCLVCYHQSLEWMLVVFVQGTHLRLADGADQVHLRFFCREGRTTASGSLLEFVAAANSTLPCQSRH